MYRFYFLPFFLLCLTGKAQQINEVRAELNKLKRTITITYNLLPESRLHEKQVFDVLVYVSMDNGKTFTGPLEYVSGDIRAVNPDINRKINWNFYPEIPEFGGEQVVFKLIGKLNAKEEERRIMQLGTTSSVWKSIAFPGWGSSEVQGNRPKWWLGVAAYSAVGSGIFLKLNSDKQYKDYKTTSSPDEAVSLLEKAQNQDKLSKYLLIGGGAIWLGDVIYTLVSGSKNERKQKEIISRKRDLSFRWHGTGLIVKF